MQVDKPMHNKMHKNACQSLQTKSEIHKFLVVSVSAVRAALKIPFLGAQPGKPGKAGEFHFFILGVEIGTCALA